MARARNIKPAFFKNELLVELEAFDRLLFIGLWCLSDREGRVENRPKKIKMEIFPSDNYSVESGLSNLEKFGFIKTYESAGKSVILILNFLKHQTPHGTEKDSELPDENGELTVNERDGRGYITGKKRKNNVKPPLDNSDSHVKESLDNTLIPESLILNPDLLIPEPPITAFAEFWSEYPRKENKGNAEKAFKRLKVTSEMLNVILIAIENQKKSDAWIKDNGKFIPHPASWLNGKRWLDEVKSQNEGLNQLGKAGQITAMNAKKWLEGNDDRK